MCDPLPWLIRKVFLLSVLAGIAPTHAAAPLSPCDMSIPCEVDGGFYHARMPAGWDGRPKLPVLIHFHGWQDEAKNVITDPSMQDFADRRDVILVVPQDWTR